MMVSVQRHDACPMCGSSNRSPAEVTYKSGRKITAQVCQDCAHFDTPDSEYAYVIRGIGHKWVSPEALQRTLRVALKEWLPDEDFAKITIEVAEIAN